MDLSRFRTWSKYFDQVSIPLTWIGGFCLLFMVAIIAVGVVLRYGLGLPILGSNEIVQLTAVALVMSALPYCTAEGGHVGVDVFDNAIGRWGRFLGDMVSRLLSGFVLSILAHRAALKALDAWEFGDATNMLRLPIWPFYATLAAGAGLCVVVFALQILRVIAGEEVK